MKRKLILLFALLAILPFLSVVSASVDTSISVQAGASQMIALSVIDPSTGDLLYSFNETQTDNSGMARFTYTSGSRTAINFSVIVRGPSGNIIRMKKFGGSLAGDIIMLDATGNTAPVATPAPIVVNTTNTTTPAPVATTNTTTTTTTSTNSTSGPNIFSKSLTKSKDFIVAQWIWIVSIIVAIIIIYVLIRLWPLIKHKIDSMPKAPTSSAVDNRPKSRIESQLLEAEKKIKQAQAEINELRNKDSKVKDAERKFEEAKRELERAKRF